jgi:hypothetical protein
MRKVSDIERFCKKYSKDKNGCWIWKAYINPQGYGYFKAGNKNLESA